MKRLLLSAAAAAALAAGAYAQDDQNVANGFAADKAYQVNDVDQINTFNGILNINLPLGQRYLAGAGLSYQFVLSYGGSVWRFETDMDSYQDQNTGEIHQIYVEYAQLGADTANGEVHHGNAGTGWQLSLGHFEGDAYISADGARHEFASKLHGESAVSGFSYSRDSTYLRKQTINGQTVVEMPDGAQHGFEGRRLKWMKDRFGNEVTVDYVPDSRCAIDAKQCTEDWEVHDGPRTHKVDMIRVSGSHDGTSYSYDVVKELILDTAAGEATYKFDYVGGDTVVGLSRRLAHHQDCRVGPVVLAPILASVTLPDLSTYVVTTDRGDVTQNADGSWSGKFVSADATGGGHPRQECTQDELVEVSTLPSFTGSIESLKRPAGATTTWTYQTYTFPPLTERSWHCFDLTNCNWSVTARYSYGVLERTDRDRDDTLVSSRSYDQDTQPGTSITTVTSKDELGETVSKTVHYYSTPFTASSNKPDYGMPFTIAAGLAPPGQTNPDAGGRFLSTKFYDGDDNLLRVAYVKYDADPSFFDPQDESSENRRVVSDRILELNEAGTVTNDIITSSSEFDGLGHFRIVTTSTGSGIVPQLTRTVTMNYNNPDADTDPGAWSSGIYPGSWVPFPTNRNWVLGTYSSQTVTEGTSSMKALFDFDPDTGFLRRQRALATITTQSGVVPTPETTDVVAVFTPLLGSVSSEKYYGGDRQALSKLPLVSMELPETPVASLSHTYSRGVLQSTSYPAPIAFLSVNQTLDASTGLPVTTFDPAGVSTTFEYDWAGRLIWSRPTGVGATEYIYNAPTASAAAFVEINGRDIDPNPSDSEEGPIKNQSKVEYDSFGRVSIERRLMPSGWKSKQTTYDSQGQVASVSEWGATLKTTKYTYDALGRILTTEAPDDSLLTFAYDGSRQKTRTSKVATDAGEVDQTTTEKYDPLGRLVEVTTPLGTKASYVYDVGGRLSEVKVTSGSKNQTREFHYDGRGFLVSETHPESGTTSFEYNARGKMLTRVTPTATLNFEYDAAERLKRVLEGTTELKLFTFDRANSGADKSIGKLASALRHNRQAPGGDLTVTETYFYSAPGGRMSSKKTSLSTGESFEELYSYTGTGQVETLTYPSCSNCSGPAAPPRAIAHQYSRGFLTGVTGYASSIQYHPSGIVSSITHTNANGGVGPLYTQALDPDAMPRPRSISVSRYCSETELRIDPQLAPKTVNSGSQANLTVSAPGATNFKWFQRTGSTDTEISGQTTATLTSVIESTIQVWVRVGNSTCTLDSNVVTITAGNCPAPTATITAPSSVLAGGTGTASVNSTSGATYVWSVENGTITSGSTGTSITFKAECSGTVKPKVIVTASCGSFTEATKSVAIGPLATATVSGSSTMFVGEAADVRVDLTGTPPWLLTWSDGDVSAGIQASPYFHRVFPDETTTYSVTTVKDAGGCAGTSSGTSTVTVNQCPIPTAVITAPASVGQKATASASVTTTPGAVYSWTITGGTIMSGALTPNVTFRANCSGTVQLTVTVEASCQAKKTVSKPVPIATTVTATLSGTTTVPQGTSAQLRVDLTGTPPWNLTFSDMTTSTNATPYFRTVTEQGTYTLTEVEDATHCAGTVSGSATVTVVPPAPTAVSATAISPTQVQVAWAFSGISDSYQIERTGAGTVTVILAGASPFLDAVAPNSAYVYRVRALKSGTPSASSTGDAATTVTFTNDPSVPVTLFMREDIEQLRTAAAALTATAGGSTPVFTDPNLAGQYVKAVHFLELRTVINQARSALGLPAWNWVTPAPAAGTLVPAARVNDLRGAVR